MPRSGSPGLHRGVCEHAQEDTRRARGARDDASRPRRRSSHACQSTTSGAATKIDEYVPEMMPSSKARMKSLIADPPKRKSASSVMVTVRLVVIERPKVCRIE